MHQQPVCSETTFCSGYSQTDVFFRQRQTSVSSGHLHVHPFTFNWWTAPQPESLSPASPHHWAHPHEKITAAALCYAIPMKERMEKRWNGGGGLYLSSPAERRRNNLLSSQRKREKANKRELKESLDRKETGDGGRCWRCVASEWANQLRPFLTSVNCCISHSFSFKQPHCVTCNTD